jgi:hypothetical protein
MSASDNSTKSSGSLLRSSFAILVARARHLFQRGPNASLFGRVQAIKLIRPNALPDIWSRAPAQFVYDIIEMTDCILEAINSSTQAHISALVGRLCPSTLSHDRKAIRQS